MCAGGAVYGGCLCAGQPRRGDLWAAALDRLARHVTLEDHGEDTSSTTDNAEHVATGDAQYAREALDIKKEDGSFKQTYGNKMVRRGHCVILRS